MKKLSVLFAVLLATGCATTGGSSSEGAGDYDSVVAEAKAAIKKAKAAGGEWRDSGKFLKKAEAAKAKGDMKTALKMAKKARFQGKMGEAQAMGQKDAGPWLF